MCGTYISECSSRECGDFFPGTWQRDPTVISVVEERVRNTIRVWESLYSFVSSVVSRSTEVEIHTSRVHPKSDGKFHRILGSFRSGRRLLHPSHAGRCHTVPRHSRISATHVTFSLFVSCLLYSVFGVSSFPDDFHSSFRMVAALEIGTLPH